MPVVQIRCMGMRMRYSGVVMPVAVRIGRNDFVSMVVMAVIVDLGVLMIERLVHMCMTVLLGQMQVHTGARQRRCRRQPDGDAAFT